MSASVLKVWKLNEKLNKINYECAWIHKNLKVYDNEDKING